MKDFRKLQTSDYELQQTNNNIDEWTSQFSDSLLEGIEVLVSVSSSTSTPVAHGLGRKPRGYFIIRKTQAVDIWETKEPTDLILEINSSATTSITLYIF